MKTFDPKTWDRMLSKRNINKETGCWLWTGSRKTSRNPRARYGEIRINYKLYTVHRVSAAIALDFDLDSGLDVLHTCDNPLCFNPSHLFFGTRADNNADKVAKGRQAKGSGTNRRDRDDYTESDVREMHRLHRVENWGVRKIARHFGRSHSGVGNILRGKRWRHMSTTCACTPK